MSNSIQNVFSAPAVVSDKLPVEVGPVDADKDFENSRKNLITMMETTMSAIQTLSMLSQQSQDPGAYDVLNKLIKTYNDQQEQLIRMYRIKATREEAAKVVPGAVQGQNVDNRTQNVFVGSPADLAKVLERMKADSEKPSE